MAAEMVVVPILATVDLATTTMPTPRLTKQYQTTTTLAPLPVVRLDRRSHQVSNRLVRSRSEQVGCFWPTMTFLGDCPNQLPGSLVSPFHLLQFENILGYHGVSWQVKDEMLALEWETYRRCFPAQPAPSAYVHSLAAAVYIYIKLHSARYPDPAPFQLQTLGSQPAR